MKQSETNLVPKSSNIFSCKYCDYSTSRKGQFSRHLSTDKHKIRTNETNETNLKQKCPEKFQCECGIECNSRTTLWRHKKKCNNQTNQTNQINLNKLINEISDKELIMMLLKQNSDLIMQNAELVKNGINNTTNSHNNNNSNNKTFNLQFFLNETCKDAMNIMDFVNSIKLQLSDLENVGKIGYVEGISNIINSNLKALDVSQRPIHCTDKKREILYIKDENKWEKENDDKTKIRKAIKQIAHKNTKLIPQFKEQHPDCGKSISKYSDQYNKLIIEAMGGPGDNDDEKEDKIIKNISKNVIIDKE
jgi:hypothetical protein